MCLHWQRRKSEAPQHEDEVFELLFSHMALNLFTEPDQAIDILKVTRQKVNVKRVVPYIKLEYLFCVSSYCTSKYFKYFTLLLLLLLYFITLLYFIFNHNLQN